MSKSFTMHCRPHWPGRPDRELAAEVGDTLFVALRRAQQPIASSCTAEAVCGKCIVEVVEGGETLSSATDEERAILEREGAGPDARLACRATLHGDGLVVTAGYW